MSFHPDRQKSWQEAYYLNAMPCPKCKENAVEQGDFIDEESGISTFFEVYKGRCRKCGTECAVVRELDEDGEMLGAGAMNGTLTMADYKRTTNYNKKGNPVPKRFHLFKKIGSRNDKPNGRPNGLCPKCRSSDVEYVDVMREINGRVAPVRTCLCVSCLHKFDPKELVIDTGQKKRREKKPTNYTVYFEGGEQGVSVEVQSYSISGAISNAVEELSMNNEKWDPYNEAYFVQDGYLEDTYNQEVKEYGIRMPFRRWAEANHYAHAGHFGYGGWYLVTGVKKGNRMLRNFSKKPKMAKLKFKLRSKNERPGKSRKIRDPLSYLDYEIYEKDGDTIYCRGYFYNTDDPDEDEPYRRVYLYTVIPIKDLAKYSEYDTDRPCDDIDDLTEKECKDWIVEAFSGLKQLDYNEITYDTPDGTYFSMPGLSINFSNFNPEGKRRRK